MGLWSTVIGAITGKNAIDKTLDIAEKTTGGILSGLDKLHYGKQEKAEDFVKRLEIAQKAADTHIELMKVTHSETTTKSITRRFMAIGIMTATFVSMVLICLIWKFDPAWAEFCLNVIKYIQLGWAFIAVVLFFFGGHALNMYKGAKK